MALGGSGPLGSHDCSCLVGDVVVQWKCFTFLATSIVQRVDTFQRDQYLISITQLLLEIRIWTIQIVSKSVALKMNMTFLLQLTMGP